MTPLRHRMLDAMTVRGLAERTQECYSGAIARMALHYRRSPELLSAAEIEAYLLHLVKGRKLSYSSVNHAASASRFLFKTVLLRKGDCPRPPMARVPQTQPHLLSREEISRLLACCAHPAYRMALQTIYATGLRVSEACALRVGDIDSVVFAARADDKGGKRKVRLDGPEFVRRFMQHILPTGIKRIRHYGLLASACKAAKLAQARAALAMPAPNPQALESATAFVARVARIDAWRCPCCTAGSLRVVQVLAGPGRLPAAGVAAQLAGCRGPP